MPRTHGMHTPRGRRRAVSHACSRCPRPAGWPAGCQGTGLAGLCRGVAARRPQAALGNPGRRLGQHWARQGGGGLRGRRVTRHHDQPPAPAAAAGSGAHPGPFPSLDHSASGGHWVWASRRQPCNNQSVTINTSPTPTPLKPKPLNPSRTCPVVSRFMTPLLRLAAVMSLPGLQGGGERRGQRGG